MSSIEETLLPKTATPLAKALDALEERLFCLPFDAITKNPDTVPVQLLDHLAWELSMDVWDPAWPDDVKRQVLSDAEELHRYKGTPYGIRLALSAVGASAQIDEWWHDGMDGVPGTFRVTAYVDRRLYDNAEFIIDAETYFILRSMVIAFSPVSRGISFRMGVLGEVSRSVSSGAVARHRADRDIAPLSMAAGTGSSAVFAGTTVRSRLIRTLSPAIFATGISTSSLKSGLRATHRLNF